MRKGERLPIHSAQPGEELGEGLPLCIICDEETRQICPQCLKAVCLADALESQCHVPQHPRVTRASYSRWWLPHDNS